MVQRTAWKSRNVIIASRRETRTHWPSPVRARSWSAMRIPIASWFPAAESDTAIPVRRGPWSGSPVTLISPPAPWMT